MLFLALCLMLAEHLSPAQAHNIDVDAEVAKQGGSLIRQLAYLAFGLVGAIGTYHVLVVQRVKLRWNPRVGIMLSLLLSWTALSLVWTDAPLITAKRFLVLGLIFLGAFGVVLSWTRTEIVKFIALSSAIQIAVGIAAELLYGYFTPYRADYRFGGILPGNSEGYVCLICALSSLCMTRLKTSNRRNYWIVAAFSLAFLLLTRSRGGLAAFMLAAILYLLVTLDLKHRILAALTIATVVLLLVISGVVPTLVNVLDRGGEGTENVNGRQPLWEDLMTYVQRRPLTGFGYEGFWTVERIDDVSEDQGWPIDQAHSGYVEGLLELGWIGAILHTLTLVIGMTEGVRQFRRANEYAYFLGASLCLVYLAGGLVEALFIVKASQSSYYFAMLLCVLAVEPELSRANEPLERQRGALGRREAIRLA